MVWLVGKKNKRGKRLRNIIASPPTEHPSSHIWKKALEPHSGHRTYNSGQIASNSGQRVSQSNQNISGRCEILSGSQAFSIYASTPSLILYFSTDPFPIFFTWFSSPPIYPFPSLFSPQLILVHPWTYLNILWTNTYLKLRLISFL